MRATRHFATFFALFLFVIGVAFAIGQKNATPPSQTFRASEVMVAAVSRDESMFQGGIGGSKWTGRGTVAVEPLAYFTSSGDWHDIPCSTGTGKGCRMFQAEYLSKPHVYTVISSDGRGAAVHANPTNLDECYGYTGTGTYSGAAIQGSAIAASSAELFTNSTVPPRLVGAGEHAALLRALAGLKPTRLDSAKDVRIFKVRLENHDLFVVQRAFTNIAAPDQGHLKLLFGIGSMESGHFHAYRWTNDTSTSPDEDERLLGVIGAKSGREFLITAVSDPESQFFRVYGFQKGHLTLLYSGGGSSC